MTMKLVVGYSLTPKNCAWTPLKIFSPYEGSSLENPNYYWPRRKMMMSLHSSSFVSTLNGYHHAIVRVKSTKNHHWDSICGPQRLCSISGPTTTTDALTQFFPCIPRFFGFNWPCQFHFLYYSFNVRIMKIPVMIFKDFQSSYSKSQ